MVLLHCLRLVHAFALLAGVGTGLRGQAAPSSGCGEVDGAIMTNSIATVHHASTLRFTTLGEADEDPSVPFLGTPL